MCVCISNVFLPPASPSSLSPSLSLTTNPIHPTNQNKTKQNITTTGEYGRAPHAETYANQMHIDFWNKCVFPPVRVFEKKGDQSVLSCFVAARMGKLGGGGREWEGGVESPTYTQHKNDDTMRRGLPGLLRAPVRCGTVLLCGYESD